MGKPNPQQSNAQKTPASMNVPRKFVPHPFAYHEEVELTIEKLSNQGDGVGRIDNWVIFVPYTLPGTSKSQGIPQ